jgi:hypothetical protein
MSAATEDPTNAATVEGFVICTAVGGEPAIRRTRHWWRHADMHENGTWQGTRAVYCVGKDTHRMVAFGPPTDSTDEYTRRLLDRRASETGPDPKGEA